MTTNFSKIKLRKLLNFCQKKFLFTIFKKELIESGKICTKRCDRNLHGTSNFTCMSHLYFILRSVENVRNASYWFFLNLLRFMCSKTLKRTCPAFDPVRPLYFFFFFFFLYSGRAMNHTWKTDLFLAINNDMLIDSAIY